MNNKELKVINDIKRNAAMNMALDDLIFLNLKSGAVLRTYLWDGPYTTIGYFQKSSEIKTKDFVRRFTGGLTVNHQNDISYSFIASSDFWPYVYDQTLTYKHLHLSIKKALAYVGIKCRLLDTKQSGANNICVQTLYENDLLYKGRKIVGSCMRRRGNKLFVQGSLHMQIEDNEKEKFYRSLSENMAGIMKCEPQVFAFSDTDIEEAENIAKEKYLNKEWNNKF